MGSFVGFFATGYLGSWLIGPPVNLDCAWRKYLFKFLLTIFSFPYLRSLLVYFNSNSYFYAKR